MEHYWRCLSYRELATLRAALNCWKEELAEGEGWIHDSLYFAEYSPLSAAEVDDLERRLREPTGNPRSESLVKAMPPSHENPILASPITITTAGKSAAAVVEEVLTHAEARGIVAGIGELIVGSTLEVCLGDQRCRDIATQHKWENGNDDPSALGDYWIESVAIEVAMVRNPDELHRAKANRITATGRDECWLVVRSDQIEAWHDYLAKSPSKHPSLIRCYGICEFIGQSVTGTRWRSTVPNDPLRDVIAKLNELVARLGSQSLPAARFDLVG